MDSLEKRVMTVLAGHVGRENAIGMAELHEAVSGEQVEHRINHTRGLREVIDGLWWQGEWICSTSDRYHPGYYLARDAAEFAAFLKRRKDRDLKSLAKTAAMQRLALPELLGQMKLEAERN